MSETVIKNKYPDYFKKGETFAETNLLTLRKFEARGMLKTILPIEKLPDANDRAAIDFVIEYASSAALRQCERDLAENNIADPAGNLDAFKIGFSNRLLELLSRPTR